MEYPTYGGGARTASFVFARLSTGYISRSAPVLTFLPGRLELNESPFLRDPVNQVTEALYSPPTLITHD